MCGLIGVWTQQLGYTADGLEALIFTAEGDMRNALNNLQSTYSGFGYVNQANVFKVCDQPHPLVLKQVSGPAMAVDLEFVSLGTVF